jgi:hypothetical protein
MRTPPHLVVALFAAAVLAACTQGAARQEPPATGAAQPAAAAAPAAPMTESAALAAAAADTAGARRLTGVEYRRAVFGNTMVREMAGGGSMAIQVGPDGQQMLRLATPQGQTGTDQGRQDVQGDRICSRWERIDAGRTTCFAYFLRDGTLIAVDLSGRFAPTSYRLRRGPLPGA